VSDEADRPPEAGADDVDGQEAEETARTVAALAKLRGTDASPRLLKAAKAVRSLLPGDKELGDPLSTSGEDPAHLLARRLSDISAQRPSVTRELGLGALQVWQAVSEAQGRGRGDREVAILFTDLVDFSSWALEAGDEATLDLLRRVGREEEAAVAERGGRVVKRLGDGLMAVFDEPRPAVEAAHDICRRLGELAVPGYEPRLRAGVHVGRPRRIGGDYLGVDVNIAARVAEAASGDEVLISGTACERLDKDDFKLKRRRRFKAKGAPKELEVYAIAARE
jgi:adenylate cyclase